MAFLTCVASMWRVYGVLDISEAGQIFGFSSDLWVLLKGCEAGTLNSELRRQTDAFVTSASAESRGIAGVGRSLISNCCVCLNRSLDRLTDRQIDR